MRLFDTHAHLLDQRFDLDRDAVIRGLANEGVSGFIECATDREDLQAAVALAETYACVYAAVGIHPHSASEYDKALEETLREACQNPKVVAIGEIGLDYHYDFSPREIQRQVLEKQLSLAKELDKPVILHSRESTADMLAILKNHPGVRGVMHCFSGSVETAKILLDAGYYLGFGGSLTFKNNVKTVEAAKHVPLDRFLLETDSPYLAPVPMRGKRNYPPYTQYVAKRLAEIWKKSETSVIEQAADNAQRLFSITIR